MIYIAAVMFYVRLFCLVSIFRFVCITCYSKDKLECQKLNILILVPCSGWQSLLLSPISLGYFLVHPFSQCIQGLNRNARFYRMCHVLNFDQIIEKYQCCFVWILALNFCVLFVFKYACYDSLLYFATWISGNQNIYIQWNI